MRCPKTDGVSFWLTPALVFGAMEIVAASPRLVTASGSIAVLFAGLIPGIAFGWLVSGRPGNARTAPALPLVSGPAEAAASCIVASREIVRGEFCSRKRQDAGGCAA